MTQVIGFCASSFTAAIAFVLYSVVALQVCLASAQLGCNGGLETSENVKQLRYFMEFQGANLSHLCVKQSPSGGRGLFANRFISSSEPIFSVPEDVIMDPLQPRPTDIKDILSWRSNATLFDSLMFYILACRRLEKCSDYWKPLFESLPEPSEVHLPIMWSSTERVLLKGTNAFLSLERDDRTISNVTKIINAALRSSRLPEASIDEVKYAHAIVVSRAFDLKFPGRQNMTRVLIPFVDLLNHRPDIQILYEFEKNGSTGTVGFKVSTNTSFDRNAEVFVNYGNTNSSSSSMFLQYGMSSPATASDSFQIMPSIARDELFDLKQEALRFAGIDVEVPDADLSISLSGDVPPKLLRCIAVLTSNKTHSARLKQIASGQFLPKSLEEAALQSLSQGIKGVLQGFTSDFDTDDRVHQYRLSLARHQVQLEKSILTRCAFVCRLDPAGFFCRFFLPLFSGACRKSRSSCVSWSGKWTMSCRDFV
jgi:hypothetical protein